MRVMHMSFGMPLISAEHEPHLPALQFQRTPGRWPASAWIWWTASSTTMPSVTSVVVVLEAALAPLAAPDAERQPWPWLLVLLDDLLQLVAHRRDRSRDAPASGRPRPSCRSTLNVPHSASLSGKSSRKWPPRLSLRSSAARAIASEHGQQVAQVERRVPARVVLAVAADADRLGALACSSSSSSSACSHLVLRCARCRRRSCIISCSSCWI